MTLGENFQEGECFMQRLSFFNVILLLFCINSMVFCREHEKDRKGLPLFSNSHPEGV
jgi:hypothetical protein